MNSTIKTTLLSIILCMAIELCWGQYGGSDNDYNLGNNGYTNSGTTYHLQSGSDVSMYGSGPTRYLCENYDGTSLNGPKMVRASCGDCVTEEEFMKQYQEYIQNKNKYGQAAGEFCTKNAFNDNKNALLTTHTKTLTSTRQESIKPKAFIDDTLQHYYNNVIEVKMKNGSIFKGKLVFIDSEILKINVEGMMVPISKKGVEQLIVH